MGDAERLTELRSNATDDQEQFWRSFRFGVGLAGVFLSTVVVVLAILAVAATVIPRWHSTVVASASMEPALRRGDTVIYVERGVESVGKGTIIVFDDDSRSMSIIHRVAAVNDDGTLTTRGDANPNDDSSPVTAAEIRGAGRVVVPWVGLLRLWWMEGRHALVLAVVAVVLASLRATRLLNDPDADPWADREPGAGARTWLGSPVPDSTTELIPHDRRRQILSSSAT